MPKQQKDTTGETVRIHGKEVKKLKPLTCQKDSPIPMPTWDAHQAMSPSGKGFVRSFQAVLNDGVMVLEILETGFRTDVWEMRLVVASRTVKMKQMVKGADVAKFRLATIARERCLRAAYAADELTTMSIPF